MEKNETIKIKGYWDFFNNYVDTNRKPPYFFDKMKLEGDEGKTSISLTFKPTKALQKLCGFEEQPKDPYDDFDYYVQYEIVLDTDDKVRLYCGDNFDTKVFDFKGNTRAFKNMLKSDRVSF
jgi:hypothetical protein